ncbi:TonB-dependent receptor plug domain-containing protein [Uliginosibacterium aquaticum]|uniref:TonB-dependent receptor plug domain-containing protein n=1 Tax=Uliginosibacterium aquaticum TaxID=2731212 RepID=A0ABX2IEG4_9RHOO|nr:TonB-dependent receptor plug domain-containing protein [Uliginosibacterium aquaticum]NSL54948.1 TonB-dependent receptor plug domain-containing protein [Uliginosibacterium aquaticum]
MFLLPQRSPFSPLATAACPARPRPLVMALMAASLVIGLQAGAHAQATPASSLQRPYAIAAGPLAEALNRFAAEAGVVLAFDAAQLKGLQSKGVQGRFGTADGFAALLAGSGFEAAQTASGSFVLRRAPASAPARKAATENAGEVPELAEVKVVARHLAGVDKLDRQMIRNMPAINGDLTSQLKLNPNIQYSEAQLSSQTAGEIAPAEISIHGAKPYQNEILLDGVSIANDLDPGNKIVTTNPEYIPGNAQALAIDSSILCDVEVKDSNVSAEYGRFTGGVVDAKICSARKRFGGSLAIGYTSSDWTHLFIDPAKQEEFENSSTADNQPRFKKWTYKTTLETRPDPSWGLLMSVVRKQSDIPLNRFSTTNAGTTESREVTQQRIQDTLVIKTDFAPAGSAHKGDVSLVYAPTENSYFIENYRNSDYTIKSGGLNLAGHLESRLAPATLSQQISFSETDQSRRSDADYYRDWRWSADKNWGDSSQSNASSGEGAWGDVDQKMQNLGYKLKSAFHELSLGDTRHRVSSGLEYQQKHAEYTRLRDTRYYLTVADLPTSGAISRCQTSTGALDSEACSTTPTKGKTVGQYFRRLMTYKAGSFDVDANTWAAYLEDEASWRNLKLRLGGRVDRDSLTADTNLSPRSSLTWQASEPLSLNVGANRYYGRNLFAYAMQEKVSSLIYTQTRSGTLAWSSATQTKPSNRLEDMRSPYDDELTAGLNYDSDWLNGPLSLRFTRRDGKDQIVKRLLTKQTDCNSNQCYVYTNEGGSLSKDLTLSWNSNKAFKSGPVATRFWFAVNKSDVKSNYSTYADVYGTALANDEIIQYDGKFIRYSEMPADNYNRPWTLRIGAMSSLPAQQLSFTNILRIRDGYRQMLQNGETTYEGTTVDVWEQTSLPRSIALDTVISWTPRIHADQSLEVKLTIENITDQKNKTSASSTYATYERGRSFALELGYSF